jgi:hypothetical protein
VKETSKKLRKFTKNIITLMTFIFQMIKKNLKLKLKINKMNTKTKKTVVMKAEPVQTETPAQTKKATVKKTVSSVKKVAAKKATQKPLKKAAKKVVTKKVVAKKPVTKTIAKKAVVKKKKK